MSDTLTAATGARKGDVVRFRLPGRKRRTTMRLDRDPRPAGDVAAFILTGYAAKYDTQQGYGWVTYGNWRAQFLSAHASGFEIVKAAPVGIDL